MFISCLLEQSVILPVKHVRSHGMSFFLKHIAFISNVTHSWPHHLISVGLSAAENVLPEPKGRAAVTQANYNHFGENDSGPRINFHFIYLNVSPLLISCHLTAANQSKNMSFSLGKRCADVLLQQIKKKTLKQK